MQLTSLTATSSPVCTFTPEPKHIKVRKNKVKTNKKIKKWINYQERFHQRIHFQASDQAWTCHLPLDPFFLLQISNQKVTLFKTSSVYPTPIQLNEEPLITNQKFIFLTQNRICGITPERIQLYKLSFCYNQN